MIVSRRLVDRRFIAADAGSITIVFAIVLPLMVLTAGIAVDTARWFYAVRSTTAALDAAVLAGARVLQVDPENPAAAIAAATKVYDSNVAARIALQSDTVSFIIADDNKAVTAKGSAYIATTLLSAAGFDRLPVASENGAGFPKASLASGGNGGSNLEIAIVLDVTGSMCEDGHGPCSSGEKISGLKAAAADLVDIAVLSDQSKLTSKAAIVPFATRIRVGPDHGGGDRMKALTNLDPSWTGWYRMCTQSSGSGSSEDNGDWSCQRYESQHLVNLQIMPCVTDRFYNFGSRYDYTDARPGSGAWLNAHGGDRLPIAVDSSESAPSSGAGRTKADPASHWNYNDEGGCADVSASNEIVPLTADRAKLKARINSLEAYGSTSGALGTAWGWYMLSPNWRSIFQGESEPAPYADLTTLKPSGAPTLRKVAVIMSDGGYNTLRGWKDQNQQTVSNHAKQLCTNMKANGIEVFTVGFALDKLPSGERAIATDTLKSCGTDVRHFYETLTVRDLKVAFRDIAVQMGTLHLSK